VRAFGYTETAVRSMTVVLSGLAVPVMVLLGRRLFGRPCGLIAGLLLALSPFFVQYEQTARSYAVVVLLVLASSYFFVAALEQPSRARFVGYALSSTLAIYAHYFAALVLLVQLMTLLALRRRGAFTREWLACAGAVLLLSIPEVVFAARAGTGGISWIQQPTLRDLVHFPSQLAGNAVLGGLLAVLAAYTVVRAIADRHGWQVGFVAAWLLVPVVLDVAVSELGHPLFVTYYLIVVLPAFLLLAAAGTVKLPGQAPAAIAIVLLIASSAVGIHAWYTRPSQEDYRGATRYVLEHERRGDALVADPADAVDFGLAYYEALAGLSGPSQIRLPIAAGRARPSRIWLVIRDSDVNRVQRLRLERSSPAGYELGGRLSFRNLSVVLYRLRAPPAETTAGSAGPGVAANRVPAI
jgi:mannosyltransferase